MSTELNTIESRSARVSPAASGSQKKIIEKPPFKLCFAKHPETGRSDACIPKINAEFITPKFYSREMDCTPSENVIEEAKEIAKEEFKTPKKLYRWPVLTSHVYGWWHDKGIRPIDGKFNFHKKTSDLVSFQMKIYSEDRKIRGLDH
ncbi:uncharacterized protein LOC122499008 [Leptopilina heterotoma]|uniref:uncharacterized protein LOC122499008 n=1 Tax=Leptopilina heterotoma TaxID=63436 RepID=UPI001CA7CF73|nr:uncharacterized protein LOC122499008 [Leptopilina heterotoma]